MTRINRARAWLGVAGFGAFLFCLSLVTILRSCEMRSLGHVGALADAFASMRERLAIWREHEAAPR